MAGIFVAGVGLSVFAVTARAGVRAWTRYQAMPAARRPFAGFSTKKPFVQGGFEPTMTRSEAAQILGVRRTASIKRVKEKHRGLMAANHPDRGGSAYVATKVNEAKDLLLKEMFT